MYSVAPSEVVDPLIYTGFVEELVEILEVKEPLMVSQPVIGTHTAMFYFNIGALDSKQEIKAAVLRTLTAIIHFEKDPRYVSNRGTPEVLFFLEALHTVVSFRCFLEITCAAIAVIVIWSDVTYLLPPSLHSSIQVGYHHRSDGGSHIPWLPPHPGEGVCGIPGQQR